MAAEQITLTVKHGKEVITLEVDPNITLLKLRQELHARTNIKPDQQKIMLKGTLKDDDKTLKELQIIDKSKLMLVGSKPDDVLKITEASESATKQPVEETKKEEENIFEQQQHKKIIEKGPPTDAIPAYGGKHEPLPTSGIPGLVNKSGVKIRLTFKTTTDELWIGSTQTTRKIPFASITDIQSHAIPSHPHYHAMVMKIGTSTYPIFWVPAQFLRAIQVAILGWQG